MLATTIVQSWAPAATAALAAVAAAASWASVRHNRRQWLASMAPHLSPQLEIRATGDVEFTVLNAGAGAARGIRFCLTAGGQFVAGYAGPQYGGYLSPNAREVIKVDLGVQPGEAAKGVVLCWDSVGRVHIFTFHGEHRVTRHKGRDTERLTDPERGYRHIYGETSLDGLQRVRGRGQRKE